MLLVLEGIVMCFVLLLVCVVAIANGAVGVVALYENDVQKRVVELGYTTEKKIKKSFKRSSRLLGRLLADVDYNVDYGLV